ncbi:MAG: Xaa-Pro peptidase family protein [Planctomycetia bacterium]|nr:Xaa-Pro peptidase family protein [Planctomycetia bacterium]
MQDRYATRRDRLNSLVKKTGANAFVVTNVLNVSYLTGFSGDDSYLVLGNGKSVLISDRRYDEQIAEECPGLPVLIREPGESMAAALQKVVPLPKGKPGTIGIEAGSVTFSESDIFLKAFPEHDIMPLDDLVEDLREIKDRWEVDAILDSLRCARKAFEVVRAALRSEQTERDIKHEMEYQMHKFGADGLGFPTIVASGARAALAHAVPTVQYCAGSSELLLIDWGAKKNFYISDLTRVLITGKRPSAKLRKIYQIVLEAQLKAIDTIKPGIASEDVDAAARNYIKDAGYGHAFGHGLGHGLGMLCHDRGGFRIGNKTILKPGMVLTVEPGIYLPGWGGIRIEDDILVTKTGCQVLSEGFPKEFDAMLVDL